jgi:hypothetical protein
MKDILFYDIENRWGIKMHEGGMGEKRQDASMVMRNRRGLLKAAFGLGAAGAAAGLAQAGPARPPISWVHGVSATITDAHGLERDRVEANARLVQGRSWSLVPLHFAVPSPAFDIGVPVPITAVWLRVKAERGATINALTLHDCELTLVRLEKLHIRSDDWKDVRIALDPPCAVARSLGLTLDCAFADVGRQISISAAGCEFAVATGAAAPRVV